MSSEALIDRYDTIETKAPCSEEEQRVLESREKQISQASWLKVNINSRQYMASPPRSSRFYRTLEGSLIVNIKLDNITRRLSVYREARKS